MNETNHTEGGTPPDAGQAGGLDALAAAEARATESRNNHLRADGIQIFIGQESGYPILDDISVVTAPYTLGNRVVGVLGIIGPTRMAYERVIPIVDVTAKLLGSALNARK